MRVRLHIEGAEYYEPDFQITKEYTPEIVRDYDNRILREKSNMTFEAHGSLYVFLCGKLNGSDGYCQKIECILQTQNPDNSWNNEFYGILDLSGMIAYVSPKSKKYFKIDLLDNSFQSRLLNRWNQKVNLLSGRSINNTRIQPPRIYSTWISDLTTGIPYITQSYRTYEVMRYLVDFIFDGQVGFQSTVIEGANINLGLIEEFRLRNEDTAIFVSFKEMFEELNVIHNLFIALENDKIVIEREDYFREDTIQNKLVCLTDHEISVDTDKLYYGVEVGGSALKKADDPDDAPKYPINRRKYTWKNEEYIFNSNCQTDNKLSLVNDFIIDSNTIESVMSNDDDGYDEKLCLLCVLSLGTIDIARVYKSYSDTFYYNEPLMNYAKLENWFCGLDLASGGDLFYGENISGPSFDVDIAPGIWISNLFPVPVDNIIADENLAISGVGAIEVLEDTEVYIEVNTTVLAEGEFLNTRTLNLDIPIYDTILDVPASITVPPVNGQYSEEVLFNTPDSTTNLYYRSPFISLKAGNIIFPYLWGRRGGTESMTLTLVDYSIIVSSNTQFAIAYDAGCSLPIIKHKFKKKIDRDTFSSMRLNPKESIILSEEYQTWIDKFTYDYKEQVLTGEATGYEFTTECESESTDVIVIPPTPVCGIGCMEIESTFIVG